MVTNDYVLNHETVSPAQAGAHLAKRALTFMSLAGYVHEPGTVPIGARKQTMGVVYSMPSLALPACWLVANRVYRRSKVRKSKQFE
jgi:hypothetical protein